MSELDFMDISDITHTEDELNKLIKEYLNTIEKVKSGNKCRKARSSISQQKLQLESKLLKMSQDCVGDK